VVKAEAAPDNPIVVVMKKIFEEEGKPVTSSLNICPEACC
jgi:hypothetical protein